MPTPFSQNVTGVLQKNVMGVADNRYGCCRQSLWALQTIVMGVADNRYGCCRQTLWVLQTIVMGVADNRYGHCRQSLWAVLDLEGVQEPFGSLFLMKSP